MSPLDKERRHARVFGFGALLLWATLGIALEAAHAFKLSPYLDHPARRELLVWGHAHGVGLALVVLAYAASGALHEDVIASGKRLRRAAAIMPLGFMLSVFGQTESDPGPAIWLVPVGAAWLLWGLWGVLRSVASPD